MNLPHQNAYQVMAGGGTDDTAVLWKNYVATRDPVIRDRLFERYAGLVHHAARETARRLSTSLEIDDLASAGMLGLLQAMETYDPLRGTAFSTWAMPRIRGAILDQVRSWDWVPRSARERKKTASRARNELRQTLGREPTPEEMAAELGVDLEAWWKRAAELADPVFITLEGGGSDGGSDGKTAPALAEVLADPASRDASVDLEQSETRQALAEAFQSLSQRDRLVLSLSYFERLTLRQIAGVLHITESRVSQIRTRALKRLEEEMTREAAA